MNIEKRNPKTYNIIIIIVLAAILLTAFGGYLILQTMPAESRHVGVSRDVSSMMQPENTQTSPTGRMVMSTGIILLLIGFGVIVVMWTERYLHRRLS